MGVVAFVFLGVAPSHVRTEVDVYAFDTAHVTCISLMPVAAATAAALPRPLSL